jgi:hypothetical protein
VTEVIGFEGSQVVPSCPLNEDRLDEICENNISKIQFLPHSKHNYISVTDTKRLLLLMEMNSIYYENHAKSLSPEYFNIT